MDINMPVIIIVIVLVVVLIVYLIVRNQKDKKKFEQEMIDEKPSTEKNDSENS